jgi:hypothetical protein
MTEGAAFFRIINRREELMSFRKRLTVLLGILALAPALLLTLPATTAWASGTGCDGNGLDTCVHVQGTGLYVDYMSAWTVNTTSRTVTGLHIELHGPTGLLKNCPSFTLAAGQTSPICTWTPKGDVRAGNYCATLWQYIAGTYDNDGTLCANIS